MKVLFIVLSGGKGTRLRPVTFFRQKTLLPAMNGERIVDFSIKSGMIHGVNGVRESKTIILAKYKSQQVIDYIQRKYPEVSVLLESHSWDTGGAMLQHWKVIQSYNPDVVIVLNGDHFVHLPVQRLLQVYNNNRLALLLVGVKSNETHHDYINMGVGPQDMLCHFCERKSEVAYTGIFFGTIQCSK